MFAVVEIAGTQEILEKGQKLHIPLREEKVGETLTFPNVLLVGGEKSEPMIGLPTVAKATVTAKILSHGREDKIRVLKFKRRKRYLKLQGHRQHYTEVEVMDISI